MKRIQQRHILEKYGTNLFNCVVNLYFDYAATSRMEDEAIGEYVKTARDYPGNPSAGHAL